MTYKVVEKKGKFYVINSETGENKGAQKAGRRP